MEHKEENTFCLLAFVGRAGGKVEVISFEIIRGELTGTELDMHVEKNIWLVELRLCWNSGIGVKYLYVM